MAPVEDLGMRWRFSVLASGSSGNATLLQVNGFGVLIDGGIGPRILKNRLAQIEASWEDVHAILLTHTHSDHWHERTMKHAAARRRPLFCHESHRTALVLQSEALEEFGRLKLVRLFDEFRPFSPHPGLRVTPIRVDHDCEWTFGFRLDCLAPNLTDRIAIGYLADLGCWRPAQVEAVADVDLLALEFNHDEHLLRNSGRPPHLIERILSEEGHLSNRQATQFLKTWLSLRNPHRAPQVVQLHLSRDCNRTDIARQAAASVLRPCSPQTRLHTSSQQHVCSVEGET